MPKACRASAITAAASTSTSPRRSRDRPGEEIVRAEHANVQPHPASANVAAFFALMQPGDTFLGLNLAAGGHLSHGSPVNVSGKWFKAVPYGVRRDDHRIDMEEVRKLAQEHKPKVIVAGGSAYPRIIDFRAFREIADSVGAKLMVDMAHFAGLVAGGVHPSRSTLISSPDHAQERCAPRGGFILTNDEARQEDQLGGVPGLQGGPLMHGSPPRPWRSARRCARRSRFTPRMSRRTRARSPRR
jgi:glycine hydroxymethyltransferase